MKWSLNYLDIVAMLEWKLSQHYHLMDSTAYNSVCTPCSHESQSSEQNPKLVLKAHKQARKGVRRHPPVLSVRRAAEATQELFSSVPTFLPPQLLASRSVLLGGDIDIRTLYREGPDKESTFQYLVFSIPVDSVFSHGP